MGKGKSFTLGFKIDYVDNRYFYHFSGNEIAFLSVQCFGSIALYSEELDALAESASEAVLNKSCALQPREGNSLPIYFDWDSRKSILWGYQI
ncbi:MAG: hypothetical protein ABI045_06405 [Flavobacteriales bacterium]